MIELIENLPAATVGFHCSGLVSDTDMQSIVVPTIETNLVESGRVKALIVFDNSFERLTVGASWDDAYLGLRHWDGFERIAIVTDQPLMHHGMQAMGLILPCPTRVFSLSKLDDARRWLSEALGTIHLDRQGDVITITLMGLIDQGVYDRIDDDLSRLFAAGDRPRVLVDLRQFEGWLALSALKRHLQMIQTYRQQPERIAVVTGELWQQLVQRLVSSFTGTRVQVFGGGRMLEAQEWICRT